MTTIVYDHKNKQIACDSRSTIDSMIIYDKTVKYKSVGDKLWFLSGSTGDADTFIQHYNPLTEANQHLNIDAIFLITKGDCAGGVYMTIKDDNHVYKECILEHNYTTGSGCEWALSALDHGKTAKEAVEYAMTRDIYSGGKIHVYDIETNKFL